MLEYRSEINCQVLIIWAHTCDYSTANQSPIVGDTILFANDKSGVVRLLGARNNCIGIDYWEVVMDWEYPDQQEQVNFTFKVDCSEKFWEKMEEFTADLKDLQVLRG